MPPDRLVLVISDLHIGADPLDDFDEDIERHFVAFLDEWGRHAGNVELVINGDLLDFVQAPPFKGAELEDETHYGTPLCFTEEQSLQKLDAIATQHTAAFEALATFLAAGDGKHVTVMPGNHDADFYWPQVRSAFTRLCGSNAAAAARLGFHLDPVYRPAGHEHLWIEHGHQLDKVNAFFAEGAARWSDRDPPIFVARSGERRLYECIGTRFLIRYLNGLDKDYPLVDNIKPFGRFLQIFGASAFAAGYPLKAAVAVGAMLRYLAGTGIGRPSDLLEDESGTETDYDRALKHAVAMAVPDERRAFADALVRAGFPATGSPEIMLDRPESARILGDFVAEHLEVLDVFGETNPAGVLSLGRAFRIDETHEQLVAAERILGDRSNGCRYVTMGHTHQRVDGDRFFNTGCWTRYYEYRPNEELHAWAMLQAGSYARFPYVLGFLRSEAGQAPTVALHEFASRTSD
jgi:UDP-2,3-diacylglucosamine pyrophosphatase LpxH